MDFPNLFDSLFELADVWASGVQAKDYADLLTVRRCMQSGRHARPGARNPIPLGQAGKGQGPKCGWHALLGFPTCTGVHAQVRKPL